MCTGKYSLNLPIFNLPCSESPSESLLRTWPHCTALCTSGQAGTDAKAQLLDLTAPTTKSPAGFLTQSAVPVPDLSVLQHLAGVPVEVGGCDVFQGVVLEGRRGGVELPPRVHQGDGEGRAVPGRGADGAHPLGWRVCRQRVPLKAAVVPSATTPAEKGVCQHHTNALGKGKMQISNQQSWGSDDFSGGGKAGS